MGRFLTAAAITLATMGAAQADPEAIRGVIGNQIEAFKTDDFDRAFTFAAPNIRGMFGTSEAFGLMVRRGYPMVRQPGTVEYLGTDGTGALWRQEVLITDGAGRLHKLRYTMVETPDGWKIAGVQILDAADVGV